MGLSLIEEVYFQAWGKAGGSGRVRRAFSLSNEIWSMLKRRAREEHSEITESEATWYAAKRMYFSDRAVQCLLDPLRGEITVDGADFQETTGRIVSLLGEIGVRFHVTGGILAAYYGDPRSTQDVDIVIDLAVNRPETALLLSRLAENYVISKEAAIEAIEHKRLFQAIDKRSMIKIDFHVGEKIPGELSRSAREEIAPGLIAPVVSKEDAILAKLYWIQQGSHRSRRDVTEMLRRDEDFDPTILKQRAAALGLLDLLDEMDREMRDGPRLA
jgi:hypothetical protein